MSANLMILKTLFLSKPVSSFWQEVWNWNKRASFCKYTEMSAMAVSLKYLYGRLLFCLSCGSCGGGFTGGCVVLLVLGF